MKKIIVLIAACLLIALLGYTQKMEPGKVPVPVKESFSKKFPGATNITYAMEKDDYEVSFTDKGVGMSANFNSKGEWLETETVMIESDLPKEVQTSVATNFVGYVIIEITKSEGPNNVVNYEMVVKKEKEAYEVKLSPKGEILKKTLMHTKQG